MTRSRAGPAPPARRAAACAVATPLVAALAGFLTCAGGAPAAAQSADRDPARSDRAGEVGPPLRLVPRPEFPAAGAPVEPPAAAAAPAEIRAVPLLPGPGGDPAAAVLQPAEAARLWAGLEPEAVAALIGQVPVGAESPAMRDLAGRLLAAPMPAAAQGPEVLGDRAARLADLGLIGALESLADGHGGFAAAPAAALTLARARLADGDPGRACAVVDRFAPDPTASSAAGPVDWRPMALLCALEAGRRDAAADLVRVLAEAARTDRDPRVATLAALGQAALTGAEAELPVDSWRVLGRADPVLVALLARAGRAQPNAVLGSRAPAVLAAVARAPANAPDLRARAAERAAAAGVVGQADLARLWAALPFDGDPAVALGRSATEQGPEIRARLMHAAARLDADGRREEAARYRRRALYLARAEAAPLPVVLAIVETLDSQTAASDPMAAAEAARALYAAGAPARAAVWRDAALAAGDREARRAVDRLWPLERLARSAGDLARAPGAAPGSAPLDPVARDAVPGGALSAADDAGLRAWFDAETGDAGEVGVHAAATVLTVLQALGHPVEPALWHRLPVDDARDTTVLPSAALAGRLAVEARPEHPAATALLSLIALGDQGTAKSHPLLLGAVVRALSRSGLDAEARQFSREAVWAAQL